MSQLKLTHGEYVHFKSKDGTVISGYLYKPLDYVPGKKYPTILRPHGGPSGLTMPSSPISPSFMPPMATSSFFPTPRLHGLRRKVRQSHLR